MFAAIRLLIETEMMNPLSQAQTEMIAVALDGMRAAYNHFEVEPCHFTGLAEDFSALDYIPYELPIAEPYAAGSLAFSLVWGHVLTTSFGFRWTASDDQTDPRMFAVIREEPSVLLYPYVRLREITESAGPQESPATSLWFDIIRYFDRCGFVPQGWHPVFDAADGPHKLGCPPALTEACRRLMDVMPEFYHSMSTYPYRWSREKQWDDFLQYVQQLINNSRLS